MVKILMGGSPCTHWSIAQSKDRETKAEGIGWELFLNYIIAKEKFKPDFFLYENNWSASKEIKEQIQQELGYSLIRINSNLVSAQNRDRFYVCNWENEQPEDRGILLKDILQTGDSWAEKSYCLTASYEEAVAWNTLERKQRSMVAEPVCLRYERTEEAKRLRKAYEAGELKHGYHEHHELHPRPDGKSNTLRTVLKDNPIMVPVRIGTIESGVKNTENDSKQYRVYSPDGKGVTLCGQGGGQGAKTGLYAVPVDGEKLYLKNGAEIKSFKNGIKQIYNGWGAQGTYIIIKNAKKSGTLSASYHSNNKIFKKAKKESLNAYEVKDGKITIKGKQYPIKLADGHYIIRKLMPVECERLQTMPDGYTEFSAIPATLDNLKKYKNKMAKGEAKHVVSTEQIIYATSAAQRYKGLGNGWTMEVIKHLMSKPLKDVPKDEKIILLSMYDGIGTAYQVLKELGFTNVECHAYEIDEKAMAIAMYNHPDTIQHGDAFQVRNEDWRI